MDSLHAGFLLYVVAGVAVTLVFMLHIAPAHGTTSIYVYITICSLVGSLSVMSCKVHPCKLNHCCCPHENCEPCHLTAAATMPLPASKQASWQGSSAQHADWSASVQRDTLAIPLLSGLSLLHGRFVLYVDIVVADCRLWV